MKRSVPLSKEQVQDNYRNQYAIPNQIIVGHGKSKKNNLSEAFEGRPEQENKKLLKSFSGANHHREEDSYHSETQKSNSVIASKL